MDQAASKIKNFFAKKKSDAKFKTAGRGVRLNDTSAPSSSKPKQKKDVYVPVKRNDLTEEAKQARDAALNRIMNKNKSGPMNTSAKAIREQARREIEEQRRLKIEEASVQEQQAMIVEKKDYTVEGVYFTCVMISEEVLPKSEWKVRIRNFLFEQLDADPGLTSCLIIKNCNTIDKAENCIETLKKYLSNIIEQPEEEKFHKIRMSNRVFCDKVAPVEGSLQFLTAAGFSEIEIDGEKFLKFSPDFPMEMLIQLYEALDLSEVITLRVDRNPLCLLPSQIKAINLPPDFFRITQEELAKEQQMRTEALEKAQILKTKAMRENEEKRFAKNFKYSLIRIRFPDGIYLQGTFGSYEKLSDIFEFVAESLHNESAEFCLVSPDGQKFSSEDLEQTLVSLRLVPNATLKFSYEGESKALQEFLKEELLLLVQSM